MKHCRKYVTMQYKSEIQGNEILWFKMTTCDIYKLLFTLNKEDIQFETINIYSYVEIHFNKYDIHKIKRTNIVRVR